MKKRSTPKSWFDSLDSNVKRVAGIISAVLIILGAGTAAVNTIVTQIDNRIISQTAEISSEVAELRGWVQAEDLEHERSLTRLELNALISSNPTNKVEIERIAKYYFVTLEGDWYETGVYSQWADQYGGDVSFVIGE